MKIQPMQESAYACFCLLSTLLATVGRTSRNGPFDGAMGFDMGGEFLVPVAGLATEGDPDLQDRFSEPWTCSEN